MILASKLMFNRFLSDETYLFFGLLSPLRINLRMKSMLGITPGNKCCIINNLEKVSELYSTIFKSMYV